MEPPLCLESLLWSFSVLVQSQSFSAAGLNPHFQILRASSDLVSLFFGGFQKETPSW